MSHKHLKDKFKKTLQVVGKIINEWDPMSLLALDCPDDEYEFEIHRIASAALQVNNAEELAERINKAFEDDYKKSKDCLMIADKILKELLN
ncbi:YugE family protein [Domibacillus indicus]|uniref:DUF1871 family protein n=1 Tax=Domibacillus indicus TaxID=1437523 RepID=UPI00203D99DE|nr:DUF1871 family protein [Domibacillus indicus]MCM3791458.1 YugE family protein [Domibacillus indicus]